MLRNLIFKSHKLLYVRRPKSRLIFLNILAEHEAAHIRILGDLLKSEEACKLFKNRKLLNKNDLNINEYFADTTAIYRINSGTMSTNEIKVIEFLKKGGVKI